MRKNDFSVVKCVCAEPTVVGVQRYMLMGQHCGKPDTGQSKMSLTLPVCFTEWSVPTAHGNPRRSFELCSASAPT